MLMMEERRRTQINMMAWAIMMVIVIVLELRGWGGGLTTAMAEVPARARAPSQASQHLNVQELRELQTGWPGALAPLERPRAARKGRKP